MWLTLATFIGYAVVYTVLLKPLTPQNIVIGGASGAMPPVLGWAAIRGDVGPEALILCLIIFLWTPPHFWALALYRAEDYRRAGLPMLPVTHGSEFTRLHVFLYTLVLFAATLLPFVAGMSGPIYLAAAIVLGVMFSGYGWRLWRALFGRARAPDLPLLDRPPDAAVRGVAGRSLPLAAAVTATTRRALALGLVGLAFLAGCDRLAGQSAEPTFHFTDITGAEFARRLDLPDADGKPRTLADWQGKVTVVFFGYTQCPDVCPTTMAELAQIRKLLGADGDTLQTVFVTIDPERDTPEILKAYVANFGPGVTALRGNAEQTAAAAKEFKVFYAKVAGKSPGSYSMDHSAASFVFDPSGKVRLYVPYGGDPKTLAADIKQLSAAG